MNARTLLSLVSLGLPFLSATFACGGTVQGVGEKSPDPITNDSGAPDSGCTGIGPGCAGGEPGGSDCSTVEECVNGTWQCNVICSDPGPPSGCTDTVIDCATSNDGCTTSPVCGNDGTWSCVETCPPPSCGCPAGDETCNCDAGAPDTGAPFCFCPDGDSNCACPVDAGPAPLPPADAGCACPPNENGCTCVVTQG